MRSHHAVDRRTLLRTAAIGGLAAAVPLGTVAPAFAAPALARPDRPVLTHGVQSGDVLAGSGLGLGRVPTGRRAWSSRCQPTPTSAAPARSADPSSRRTRTSPASCACPARARTVHYRVTAEDLDGRSVSEPVSGSFRTLPGKRDGVRFLWSGDVVGQGWGINPDLGGMRIYEAMRRTPAGLLHPQRRHDLRRQPDRRVRQADRRPDVAQHRDPGEVQGRRDARRVPRAATRYNLLDENVRAFNAAVPQINQWDDHEVAQQLVPRRGASTDAQYTEKRVDVLAAKRASRRSTSAVPMDPRRAVDGRVYRRLPTARCSTCSCSTCAAIAAPNTPTPSRRSAILGEEQAEWLVGRARLVEGDVEGGRGRHADRASRCPTAPRGRPSPTAMRAAERP